MQTMERGDGHGVGNVLDSEHCVSNGLDRERVDLVNVDRRPASDVPSPNTSKDNKSITSTTAGTQPNNCNHKISQATLPTCRTSETIQLVLNAAAVGIRTPGNTVYMFLSHYN